MVFMDEADWIININLEMLLLFIIHLRFKGQGLYPSCIVDTIVFQQRFYGVGWIIGDADHIYAAVYLRAQVSAASFKDNCVLIVP